MPVLRAMCCCQVNKERTVIQELQYSPMGVITLIEPRNNYTDKRLGVNLFQLVRGQCMHCVRASAIIEASQNWLSA